MLDNRLKNLVRLVDEMDSQIMRGKRADSDFYRLLTGLRFLIDHFADQVDEKNKKIGQLLKSSDKANEQNKLLHTENTKLREQVSKMLNITPCTKSKPDPKTTQEWLSMPLSHFPTDKKVFGSRLKMRLEGKLHLKCKEQERSVQLGDVLLFDPNSLKREPNIGKVSIQQLKNWQAKWRQEFGEDFEKELKIWEAS